VALRGRMIGDNVQTISEVREGSGSGQDSGKSVLGVLGWFGRLTSAERHTWFASFGGLALDAMNSQAYALALPSLIIALHLSTAQAGTFATAALVGSGIGGWAFGRLADLFGRIRMLQLAILLCAISTFASAFATTFWQLLVARSFQGIGYGGGAAVGAVLVSEGIRAALRGRAAASVQSGYAIGYAIAVGFMAIVFHIFREAVAWRVLFALGILPIVFLIYIRRWVPESPLFEQARKKAVSGHRTSNFGEIFRPPLLQRTAVATLLATAIFGAAYVQITWLPTYLRTVLHLNVTTTAWYLFLNILGSFVGPLVLGPLSDKIGRRWSLILFLVSQAVAVGIYTMAPITHNMAFFLGFVVGLLQGGLGSSMLPAFAEIFPTQSRGHGQGFSLSIGRGLGSLVPASVGVLAGTIPLGRAMGMCAICSYLIAMASALLFPETMGKNLQDR
jgi:MFS family permease